MVKEIVTVAADAAREAGNFLAKNFGRISRVEQKGDRNLVTDLDQTAEKMIVEKISAQFPTHSIIGEEGGKQGMKSDYLWIIDPLDGTHNFIRGIHVFGVSIGILYKEHFVAGVIYMPLENELYVGEEGNGAYKNERKISVSNTADMVQSSISFDSSIRYSPEVMLKILKQLSVQVFNIRMFGSSVRALSYLAEGKIDFSVEFHDRPWDFAGGVTLIREAGGTITDLKGNDILHSTIGYIGSNGFLHKKIREIVRF
ncbi:MAG: inositol monophosphatase [Candidatus Omnitrophica bacterium]|nr:inositol monophosphatase [Candidatus Omnitrophota bacterium]